MAKSKLSLFDALSAMYEVRSSMVFCLLGAPGIGKTEAIKEFADSKGVQLHEIYANTSERCEAGGGATMLDLENRLLVRLDDEVLMNMKDGDILLYDEVLTAPQPILNAMLKVLMDRKTASGRKLPDVMIIAAANKLPSASMLPLPIRQRFYFYEMEWDKDAWVEYIKDTLDITVGRNLIGQIKLDGTDWNVLTPRSCTKLLAWAKDNKDKIDVIQSLIDSMFGSVVAYEIVAHATKESPIDKVNRILRDHGVCIDGLEPGDILEYVQAVCTQDVYEDIKAALAAESTVAEGVAYVPVDNPGSETP